MSETVDATSDDRKYNNTMRHEYRVLTAEEKQDMLDVKDKGLELFKLIDKIGSSREMSLAKTRVEEAIMWATKHITR